MRTMSPHFLSTLKEQRLKEEYGEYCLRSILSGEVAKPIEEFQGECEMRS
jgi:hypothetical protein